MAEVHGAAHVRGDPATRAKIIGTLFSDPIRQAEIVLGLNFLC